MHRRQVIAAGAAAAAAWPFVRLERAAAQIAGNAFIVSGFPAGGMGDLLSRPLSEKLRARYATNVLVDNRVGAGGRLAAEYVKRANPDGLTILQIPASIMTLYPHTYKSLNYDPLVDFIPVTSLCTYMYSFTASAALPAEIRTVADFVAWARANPKQSTYGIPAAGSSLHFAGMMLQRAAGIELTAVPYRGGAPLLTDMLAGVIPVSFNVLGEVLPHVRDYHRARGIPETDSRVILADLGRHLAWHRHRFGTRGLYSPNWLNFAFRGMIYQLGRLQFERVPYKENLALSMHIPDFCGPLSPEAVDDSLDRARRFFARHFPSERYDFAVCHSWLLCPQLAEHLPPESNIMRFQARFTLDETGVDNETFLQFVKPGTRIRAIVEDRIARGESWLMGSGFLVLNEQPSH